MASKLIITAIISIAFAIGLYSGMILILNNSLTGKVVSVESTQSTAIVTKVIDGDTIELQNGERVRLLGINTPERGQYYYEESTERLKELVLDKSVTLEADETDRDQYGRLLMHVYIGDTNVNLVLVKEGYANVFFMSPNMKHFNEFKEAEKYAEEDNLGIWTRSGYTDCIGISYFHYNAKGNDNENLNDEYVKFRNSCDFSINMEIWTVKDEATHIYTFPDFILASMGTVTLYSGPGTNTLEDLYWNNDNAIWNNGGDTLYLWDGEGKLVLYYEYE